MRFHLRLPLPSSEEPLPDEKEFEVLSEETMEGEASNFSTSIHTLKFSMFHVQLIFQGFTPMAVSFPESAADLSNRKRKASETDALEKETKKFKEDSANTTISI